MIYLVFKTDGSIVECEKASEVTKILPQETRRIFRGRDVEFETKQVLSLKKSEADSNEVAVTE